MSSIRSASRAWLRNLVDDLARRAERQAKGDIPSRTLRDALIIKRPKIDTATLHIPHYWAYYVHEGTAAVKDTLMIWFKEPHLDPRLAGGYPRRLRDRKRLSKAEFLAARKAGLLVVAYARKAITGRPFFDNAGNMAPFIRIARSKIPFEYRKFVNRELRDIGVGRPITI